MRKFVKIAIFSALATVVVVPSNLAVAEGNPAPIAQEHVLDEIIVGYSDRGTPAENASVRENSHRAVNATSFEKISPRVTDTEIVKLGKGLSVEAAIARLKNQPGIRFAEPNYIVHALIDSTDPYFTNGSLWGMYGSSTSPKNDYGSNAASAWANGYTGSSNVVVGVIDEGIQVTHPDLAENIWNNPGETNGDGIDNDGNGYIDDFYGWDFVNNNATVYDGTSDDHATHVAGTIGANGNSIGVAGVNWNVKMISTKFLGSNGGTIANAVKALNYLIDLKRKGANIVATNNSWGGGGYSQALQDAINASGEAGMLFIAAAGNSTTNNDISASYPSNYSCTSDCVIAVAAIDSSGAIASFSSYGKTTVDLGAPGVGIWSTLPFNTYGSYSGTSMATPHVTGAAALCKSINPLLTASQVKSAILDSAESTTSLKDKTLTGGRLNVGGMATNCSTASTLKDQATLIISNTTLSGPAGTAIDILTTGGSGTGAISFGVIGSGCVISTNKLNVTLAPTSCDLTAFKASDTEYKSSTSESKSFSFYATSQGTLRISNTKLSIAKGNPGVTLTTSGGSGTGAVTFTVTGANCVLMSNKLTVAKSISGSVKCSVTATKAASGIYGSATSAPVEFTFN